MRLPMRLPLRLPLLGADDGCGGGGGSWCATDGIELRVDRVRDVISSAPPDKSSTDDDSGARCDFSGLGGGL